MGTPVFPPVGEPTAAARSVHLFRFRGAALGLAEEHAGRPLLFCRPLECRVAGIAGRLFERGVGEVHLHVGNYEQAAQAHQQELALLSSQSAGALALAEAHFALGRVYHWWSKYDQALDWFDRYLGKVKG